MSITKINPSLKLEKINNKKNHGIDWHKKKAKSSTVNLLQPKSFKIGSR
jgi:hypothetical protein